jgi:hypothetical protein
VAAAVDDDPEVTVRPESAAAPEAKDIDPGMAGRN